MKTTATSFAILAAFLAVSGFVLVVEAGPVTADHSQIAISSSSSEVQRYPSNEEILLKCIEYFLAGEYEALVSYLKACQELKNFLDWLEKNYLPIFVRICWMFDYCGVHDAILDPATMQKIMYLMAQEKWDELADYIRTIDNYEMVLAWIKSTFPDAWRKLCVHFSKC